MYGIQTYLSLVVLFVAANPVFSCGGLRGRAPECIVPCKVKAKVIFVLDSPWSRREVTEIAPPAIDMIIKFVSVRGVDGAVLAPISSDVDKLVTNAPIFIRGYKKISIGKRRANVIMVVHGTFGREVASSSPVSGCVPDGLHTG